MTDTNKLKRELENFLKSKFPGHHSIEWYGGLIEISMIDWFLSRTIPKEEVKRVVGEVDVFDRPIRCERQRILSELGLIEK